MVKVSVAMVAYNHEQYVGQAIDSILMQQTSFPFELVVSEDCSTDRTREIVLNYARQNPDKIRAILGDKNIGVARNYARAIRACVGEYVALMDSDDYWTSPLKLQKQADFLDQHPACATCFHSAAQVRVDDDEVNPIWDKTRTRNVPRGEKPFYDMKDILEGSFIATSATMFRRGLFGEFPAWFDQLYMPDHALHALNAQYGLFGYIPEDMSVYREHSRGIWSGATYLKHQKGYADLFEALDRHLNHQYSDIMNVTQRLLRVATIYHQQGDYQHARLYVHKAIQAYPRNRSVSLLKLIGTWLAIDAPRIHRLAMATKQAVRSSSN